MKNQHRKILIVDDDARNIFALNAVLRARKYECLSASDMNEAIKVLETTPGIGIILLDMMMPEMDGYEAIPKVRDIKQYEAIPIIAVTAQAMKGDREKCIRAGASNYIAKPVNIDELESILKVYLEK